MAIVALAVPAIVGAQSEALVLTGGNGVERIRLVPGPALASSVSVLSSDGVVRAQLATGGQRADIQGTFAAAAGFNLFSPGGGRIARLGVAPTDTGEYNGVSLLLQDLNGVIRARVAVDVDGNPSIELLDRGGSVIWAAP